ncbi:Benzoate 4-monooxygenase cytochrome P450 [Colletotrichum higginsianum IMI 349063]|uniref:Benzoate 4-monooxygenase cytochrome P450 n=3 Tax=Colletotrichum higginsianum TaxID=80884 RepID=A0A1B7Y024_COLHI|nr:Benzoate 4-monooxygenase cytochrome P450 [Colletotrichum higginsianum IMI 349063]OBR05375.1 Benzoate 4-monooxygenase cytochrome P450 [Colletotrichum higginsianum IMI 349063]
MTPVSNALQTLEARGGFFVIGVLLHQFLFRYGEWDLSAKRIITRFCFAYAATISAIMSGPVFTSVTIYPIETVGFTEAMKTSTVLFSSLIVGIYSSMMIYRGFFHRLHRFPGPFLARFTNLYITFKIWNKMHLHEDVRKLHEKYGDVVRVGPTELSINKPGAINAVFLDTDCMKGPWYNLLHPMVSMQMVRDKEAHSKRRKAWEYGFTSKALRDYEPRVLKYTEQLLAGIETRAGAAFNAALWFNFYSFDVMGEFSLGRGFRMLEDGASHFYMDALHDETRAVGRFTHAMWALPLYRGAAVWNAGVRRFKTWIAGEVRRRIENKPESADIFTWVLEDYEAKGVRSAQDMLNLFGDCILITVAGSDTVAAVLSCLFMELARHPKEYKKLQEEIDECFRHHDKPEHAPLSKLRYLQACIDESLRLHPPVPSGVQRVTPPEGLKVDDVWLQGDTIVFVPSYTQYRDVRFFERPDEFIPERWTDRPELVKNAAVYVPFSTGHDVCIGKQLGLMETRFVTSAIVHRFNVEYAEGQTGEGFLEGNKDTGTLTVAPLQVVFTPRKS